MIRDVSQRFRLGLTFRHLVILILYLAILFKGILPLIKLVGITTMGSVALGALVLSPIVLALLVGLIERPGALKNWVLSLLLVLFFPALVLNHDCAVFVAYLETGRRPTLWVTLLVNAVVLINSLPILAKMAPRPCPSCGRRTLVPLLRMLKHDRRTANTCWCSSCSAQHWKDKDGNWRPERRKTWLDEETERSTTTPQQAAPGTHPEAQGTPHRPVGGRSANEVHSS